MGSPSRTGLLQGERVGSLMVFAGLALALVVTPIIFCPALYDDFTLVKQVSLFAAAACVLLGLAWDGYPLPGGRWFAIALGAWLAGLSLSEAFSIDRRSSLLGVYQYREGLLTQLAYVVLLLGAANVAAAGRAKSLLLLPVAGLAGVFLYTALQATGNDPVEWWVDTSERAIGTIGNANELAAYAVLALAAAAPVVDWKGRCGRAAPGVIAAASGFIVLESESRAGLAATCVFILAVPICWWLARRPLRSLATPGTTLMVGFLIGGVLSLAAGGLAGSAGRVQDGVAGQDAGGSTRLALWRGSAFVVKADLLTGAGPDGLILSFPRHRPADLGGAFDSYDLPAQSSHNYALDTAANYGVLGLVALVGIVSLSACTSVWRCRNAPAAAPSRVVWPVAWAALAAYGSLTLLNPISLAPHSLFFVLLGLMLGEGEVPRRTSAEMVRWAGLVVAGSVALAVLVLGFQLPRADVEANRAWEAVDEQRFEDAARHYAKAAHLIPVERRYAEGEADSWLAAAVSAPEANLLRAEASFEELDDHFGFGAGDALALVAARIARRADPTETTALIDRAFALNPNGRFMKDYTERLRRALIEGGELRYSQRDHWTFVVIPRE